MKSKQNKGFTLLELLIVVAIIAILALIVIIVLDPAETLKKSRDAQRLADMTTLKTAIGVYTTTTSTSPILMETISTTPKNFLCKGTDTDDNNYDGGNDKIWYSLPYDLNAGVTTITDSTLDGGGPLARQVSQSNNARADGNGWLPVPLNSITGGSPISNLPVDPINSIENLSAVADTDFVYRYSCSQKSLRYEIDSQLESTSFTTTQDLR
jgi:prepilin-type N-terminal cleavage/methylation domain-containing protein